MYTSTFTSLKIEGNLSIENSNVNTALSDAISYADSNIDIFELDDLLIDSDSVNTIISNDNGSVFNNFVVETSMRVAGISINSFLGTNENGTAYDSNIAGQMLYILANISGSVYVSNEIYVKYTETSYIKLSLALFAIKGLFEDAITVSRTKRSLHKLDYTVDFEVSPGVIVDAENFDADIIVTSSDFILDTDASFLINDGVDKIVPFITKANFKHTSTNIESVVKSSHVVQNYEWLKPNISSNTLLKGLFGEFLADSPVVSIIRDTNNDNIVSNTTLTLNVSQPSKHSDEIASSGANLWTDLFYELEHKSMFEELSNSFLSVWSETGNIDWYVYFFNLKQTGSLFNNGDTFEVPVEITMTYSMVGTGASFDVSLENSGNLTALTLKKDGTTSTSIPSFQKKYRLLYKFNVETSINQLLYSGNFSSEGIDIIDQVYSSIYYKMPNGLYAKIPSSSSSTTNKIGIFNKTLLMQLTSTTSSNMSFFERFYTDSNNLYTLQELQSQSNDTIQKDAVLTNQYVDMIQFFNYLSSTDFTTVYKKCSDNKYIITNAVTNIPDADITANVAVFESDLFVYDGVQLIDVSPTVGNLVSIDTSNAVVFHEPTAVNLEFT